MYIEVFYIKNNKPHSHKWKHYPPDVIHKTFEQTVAKMMATKTESLVVMRSDEHELIKSKRV